MNFFRPVICLALLAASAVVFGQGITTASFSGSVVDKSGEPLPGAVVQLVHEPTGTRYSTVSRANGEWRILHTRVGGPYVATATMTGFKTQQEGDIFVKIAEDYVINFTLTVDTVEESIVVVAESNPLINPAKTGATSNVSEESIEALPSISRSLEDFARTNPYFTNTSNNDGQGSLTVAGRSNRYNTILIDGAVNNDLFGLSATGAPGGQAESPFIALDAIAEVQLLVAPYDIRQSGFSGGGVNAVTRSGSNSFEGSVFHYSRSDSMIGDGPTDTPFGDFDEKQSGLRIGGPIVKDKVFFFFSGEARRKEQPVGWAVRPIGAEGTGQNFGHIEEITEIANILREQYGYDPGGLEEAIRPTDSDSFFARLDVNLSDGQTLTLRHNFVDAENLRAGNDFNTWQFPSNHQFFPSETNSTVLQWNAAQGELFHEARVSYTTVRDRRTFVGDPFPWIEIENVFGEGQPGAEVEVGSERFSTKNSLDQNMLEINYDLTFFKGDHTLTIGTHNELFNFDNLFIREAFGSYEFDNIEHFRNGWARTYNHSFSADPSNPDLSAKFDVQQFGLYVGDLWQVTPDFNLTMGLRVDAPFFPDTPTRNPLAEQFGFRTDVTADGNMLMAPRVGFNWDMTGDSKNQLRGGSGVFTGRTPYVWVSNQYTNTGIEFNRISVFNTAGSIDENNHVDFVADPFDQPKDPSLFTNASGNEINVIDPDFQMPQVWRSNIAYDRDLGFWNIIGTVEVIYSKNVNDIIYRNLNWQPSGETFFDGRPMFTRVNNDLRDVILLDNTNKGSQTNMSIKFERPMTKGLAWAVSYLNGDSESVNDGTSSQARSNWRFNNIGTDPNNPELGTSAFQIEHRFNAMMTYRFGFEKAPTTVSLFYNSESGRPYSTTYRNDVNGDRETNDLMYIPASPDEVVITSGTWEEFDAYISADPALDAARGTTVERNVSRAPYRRTLDFRLTQDVRVRNFKFQLTWDILNFMNWLDSDEGTIVYANFNELSPVQYDGLDEATGKPIYRLRAVDLDRRFTRDNLRSRYQMQLGARFTF